MSEHPSRHVLFVGLVWPEPTSTAAGQNILSYINLFLNCGYAVTFACAADKSEHSAELASLGVHEQAIILNDSSFDTFVAHLAPDIAIFDRFICEEQFAWRVSSAAPNCMKILDCEDLHFLRDARHKAYKDSQKANTTDRQQPFNDYLYSDMCKRELASIMRCDLSILLSSFECSLLTDVFAVPSSILLCCPFLLADTSKLSSKSFEQRLDFVSIGSFRHAPNWDAVLTLKQKIWPAIHKALPKARCHVYGSYLTPKAKQLENKNEGFLVHGYAADAHEVIGNARVLLAPLNFGAGIKGKLVDAMQCSTPSITTDIGAEGLMPNANETKCWPGAVCSVAHSADEFVCASIALYSKPEAWSEASNKSHLLLSSMFDYKRQSQELLTSIDAILLNLRQHRQQHFLGQVMQHHTLTSSKYMSQWIEAKTRLQELQEATVISS